MVYFYFAITTWLILFFCGLPLARYCLPSPLLKYRAALAPILGFCYIIFASYFCYRLNLPGSNYYAGVVLFIPIVALVFLPQRISPSITRVANKDEITAIAMAVIGLIIASFPYIIITGGQPLAISIGNLDLPDLACASRFLQEFARDSKQGFLGQTGFFQWISDDIWFGPSAIVAFVCSLLGSAPYKLQSLVMNVVACQGVCVLYILLRELLSFTRFQAIIVSLLYSVSPVLMYTVWQGFGGQIVSMPLVLGLLLLTGLHLKECVPWSKSGLYVILAVIFESGMLVSYHYFLIVTFVLIVSYVSAYWILSRFRQKYLATMAVMLASLTLAFLLNPWRLKSLINALTIVKSAVAGWFIPFIGPDTIFGLNGSSFFLGMPPHLPSVLVIGISIVVVGTNLIFLVKNRRTKTDHVAFFLGLTVPTFALAVYFALPSATNTAFGGYRSYKVSSALLGISLCGNLLYISALSRTITSYIILAASTLPLLLLSMRSTFDMANFMKQYAYVLPKEVEAIQNLESYQFVDGLNIPSNDVNTLIWTNYFTLKKKQVFQTFPYGGRVIGKFDPSYFFLAKDTSLPVLHNRHDIFAVTLTSHTQRYQVGAAFFIYRAAADQNITLTPRDGWWGSEGTHRWSGKNGSAASILLDSSATSIKVTISAKYSPLQENDHFTANVEGKIIVLHEDNGSFVSEPIELHAGENLVTFNNTMSPSLPSPRDPRTLGVLWTDITVRIVP